MVQVFYLGMLLTNSLYSLYIFESTKTTYFSNSVVPLDIQNPANTW